MMVEIQTVKSTSNETKTEMQLKFETEKTDAISLLYTDSRKVMLSRQKIGKSKIVKHVWT